ncbi:MAG TPA: 2OG-Fe(II) oxygenase [Sphingomicrobium sp.]
MTERSVDKARALFGSGLYRQGMDLLSQAARSGDADALEMLASMALSGQIVNRDLPLSRDLFGKAAQAGSASAAETYRAFVANGTGAPADWAAAMKLLDDAARTDANAALERKVIGAMNLGDHGEPRGPFPAEQLSTSPDVRLFPDLFTSAECDFLVERSQPTLQPSLVVDPQTGQHVPNPVRTSDAVGFPLVTESPAIHALCRRLAEASGTHVKQGEPLQVLRYRPGQQYRAHFDAIGDADNQRVLTFLVYLNDDYEGGETEFLATGLKVKGKKGDGLLFRNADASGKPDDRSQHAGLPVTAGEKYLASRWIRERRFTPE